MIMDMVVKLADGFYVDLEIQRITVEFPFEWAVCYASDMVVRQYEQLKMEQKQAVRKWKDRKKRQEEREARMRHGISVPVGVPEDAGESLPVGAPEGAGEFGSVGAPGLKPEVKFSYESLRPVYVIVLMNSSADKYSAFPEQCIHRTDANKELEAAGKKKDMRIEELEKRIAELEKSWKYSGR